MADKEGFAGRAAHLKKKKKNLGCQGGRTSVSESMFSNSLALHSGIWERRTYASLARPT